MLEAALLSSGSKPIWAGKSTLEQRVRARRIRDAASGSISNSRWTARSARNLIGWRTVVSGGHTTSDIGVSSKPVTDIADGISRPARCSANIAPAAMSSLAQASAVTDPCSRSSRSAASTPEWNVKSPVAVQGWHRSRPREARRRSRRSEARRTGVGRPFDEAQTAMAKRDEMLADRSPGSAVVDADCRNDRTRPLPGRNGDHPDSGALRAGDQLEVVRQRRGNDDPGRALCSRIEASRREGFSPAGSMARVTRSKPNDEQARSAPSSRPAL